jgi:hypothetical protein
MYVGATRATDTLILVETSKPIPFLKYSHHEMMYDDSIKFVGDPLILVSERPKSDEKDESFYKTSPTHLIKFINENVLMNIVKMMNELFKTDHLSFPLQNIKLLNVINNQDELSEEVFDINGLFIPALFEERTSGEETSTIKIIVKEKMQKQKKTNHILNSLLENVNYDDTSIEDYLKIVNVYISMKEGLYFKIAQIKDYHWLSALDVEYLINNMKRHIKEEEALSMIYEHSIIESSDGDSHKKIDEFMKIHEINEKIRFTAIVDAISDEHIWEFKCVDSLEPEHLIQLIIYAWLWKMSCEEEYGIRIFKIINIRTSEVLTLNYNDELINSIILLLIKEKFSEKIRLDDDTFINKCLQII